MIGKKERKKQEKACEHAAFSASLVEEEKNSLEGF